MLHFKCGCGAYNYNFQDWIAHFKYQAFSRALHHLLLTKIQFKKED